MDNNIQNLFSTVTHQATEEQLELLKNILEGFHQWQTGNIPTLLGGLLQMERTLSDECYEITIPISPLLYNTLGIVHGGITATLLDTAMGLYANSLLPEGYSAVTTQLNVHYIATGRGEKMTCKAKFVHKGTKTCVMSAEVLRSDGVQMAFATGSFLVIEKKSIG